MRGNRASVVASPVLIGAATVLVSIVAVFLAYNANSGLPFVPTYDVSVELPSGAKLVRGNDVRVGGFRVGAVDDIRPTVIDGQSRAIVDLKLDKVIEPLPVDTQARVRSRSALGLKYLELTPGNSSRELQPGDAISLENSSEPLELEDVLSTFDDETRQNSRRALEGFGDAFAGRGPALNEAIGALAPFFRSLEPVMTALSDPETELDELFVQLGRSAAQAAPVATTQARLFTDMADTFAAISRNPEALRQTIERSPETLDVATSSLRVQTPFLADFADLSRRLRPAARELPRSLPDINTAFRSGTRVLPQTVALNERLEGVFNRLDALFENPSTQLALTDIRDGLSVLRPLLEYITPYQTVCNYPVYFWSTLGEHWSQVSGDGAGTVQNQGIKMASLLQPNTPANTEAARHADVPPDEDPQGAQDAEGTALLRLYQPHGQPAVDAQGNADCQLGQTGYVRGPLRGDYRFGPGLLSDGTPTGGNWPVAVDDLPGLRGGTFVTRRLGIGNVRDVP